MKTQWLSMIAVASLGLAGCAGTGERIDVRIPGKFSAPVVQSPANRGIQIAVMPFEDQRRDRTHVGTRSHLGGGVSYFDLSSGSVGNAAAHALVEYFNRHGWHASLSRSTEVGGADVTIRGIVQDLSIDAVSKFMRTDLSAKSTLSFEATNHADGSSLRQRVPGSGTDQVFWFDPEDAQALLDELLEKNFETFLGNLKVDGRTLRFK